MDIVVDTKSLSTLEYALKVAGLLDVFAKDDLGVSVLAPDDAGKLALGCAQVMHEISFRST